MRADRLLSILLLLQTNGRMTARDLAGRLEVSERTVYRDMDALSTAGVPVYAERGAGGGWALVDGYETHLTGLSLSEVQAVFATRPVGLLADLGLGAASEAALLKLLAALPQGARSSAEHARQRLHVDTSAWRRADEDLSALPVLQDAVWRDRRVRFTYLRAGCEPAEREGDALGLVAKGSAWYLVAAVDGDVRAYRVGRVRDAVVLDEPAARPDGFDLAAYWEASSAEFREKLPRYDATVRVAPNLKHWMWWTARYAHVEREGEPDADGWVEMEVRFQVVEEAETFALSFGPRVEVLAPPELRERVRALTAEAAARYGPGTEARAGGPSSTATRRT
jgi:predicted DNA-binding transcriptional regulator YafY